MELTYSTTDHHLPPKYFALHRRLRAALSDRVLVKIVQPQHAEALRSDPAALSRCVRDCCVLMEPMTFPFVRTCAVRAAGTDQLKVTVPDAEARQILTAFSLPERISSYFQDVYGVELCVHVEVGETEPDGEEPALPEEEAPVCRPADAAEPERPRPEMPVRREPEQPAPRKAPPVRAAGGAVSRIADLQPDSERQVTIDAQIVAHEAVERKNGELTVHKYAMCDFTSSLTAVYLESSKSRRKLEIPGEGSWVRLTGTYEDDRFEHQPVLRIRDAASTQHVDRMDKAAEKRVELHAHTKMSAMDAVTDIGALIRRAAKWGHPAVAITDHGVGQAFPIAAGIAEKAGIKIIYGVEGYLFDDEVPVFADLEGPLPDEIVVVDKLSTSPSPLGGALIGLTAVRLRGGREVDRFQSYVRTDAALSPDLFTGGLREEQIRQGPPLEEAAAAFREFVGSSAVAGADGPATLRYLGRVLGCEFAGGQINIDAALRCAFPELESYKPKSAAKALRLGSAAPDALLSAALTKLAEHGTAEAVNALVCPKNMYRGSKTHHIILLCRDQQGMTALNRLISASHVQFLDSKKPKIPRSLLREHRSHLLVGSACESGELFRAVVDGAGDAELAEIASFYDYLEVQPLGNNGFLLRNGIVSSKDDLIACNRRIVELGDALGKPVAATCDVHFLDPEDECYRRLLQHSMGFDAAPQPPLYLRTTEEMEAEFSYLGPEKAHEIVCSVPNQLADMVETFALFPDETVMPVIDHAAERIEEMAYENARRIYGEDLPEIVRARLERELDSIIRHGFSVLYYSAHLLVKKSNEDGYLVGSRGSVGSSLAATMTGITEVNPLPPHYVCPDCQYSDFDIDTSRYDVGPDLPDAVCPKCGAALRKEGFNIPFEVFLGIDADKVPDIDLNFSGEYQSQAHAYTEEIFGRGHVFRAGTILSLKDKNAVGYVRRYLDDTNSEVCSAEFTRLSKGLENVKKSTGKHPGGMVIVPRDREVYEFTAVQWPANKPEDGFVTTHYGFDSMHDILVKLDILGHDGPTIMKLIKDITGRDPLEIPLADPDVLRLFSTIEPLGIDPDELFGITTGTLGIPEFGTPFVREMLKETQPGTVAEIVRISGLSHGTDVWLDNAQSLIRQGVVTLSEAICARDDIMNFLVAKGVDKRMAFFIMEATRKGKVARQGFSEEQERALEEAQIPDWFVQACRKIKYMFPKGHAVAYTLLSLRIAYCKLYEKAAFYATFFDVHVSDFSADMIRGGLPGMRQRHAKLLESGGDIEKREAYLLELACEMYLRGLQFLPVDLEKSDPIRFQVEENGLRMPFVSIPQLGEKVAQSIAEERTRSRFLSVRDLEQRTHVSSTVTRMMREMGILDGLPESNQLSIFDSLG